MTNTTNLPKPTFYMDTEGNKYVRLKDWENSVLRFTKIVQLCEAEIAELKHKLSEQAHQPIPKEPVFDTQASPDARCTNPAENSGNQYNQATPIDRVYWEARAAIRNAILRLPNRKVRDVSELFEEHRTSGKTLWKLTDELETVLLEIVHQTKKPLLEEILKLKRTVSHKDEEISRERWMHKQTVERIARVIGMGKDIQERGISSVKPFQIQADAFKIMLPEEETDRDREVRENGHPYSY